MITQGLRSTMLSTRKPPWPCYPTKDGRSGGGPLKVWTGRTRIRQEKPLSEPTRAQVECLIEMVEWFEVAEEWNDGVVTTASLKAWGERIPHDGALSHTAAVTSCPL